MKKRIVLSMFIFFSVAFSLTFFQRYWIWEHISGMQVLWNKKECYVFIEIKILGWSGSYFEELLYSLKNLFINSGTSMSTLRKDLIIYHYGNNSEIYRLTNFGSFGRCLPFNGNIYHNLGDEKLFSKWEKPIFVEIDSEQSKKIRGSYNFLTEAIKREGWSEYELELSFQEGEKRLPIKLENQEIFLLLRNNKDVEQKTILLEKSKYEKEIIFEVKDYSISVSENEFLQFRLNDLANFAKDNK